MNVLAASAILLLAGAGPVHAGTQGRCASAFALLHSPDIDRPTRKALAESMRRAGCLGRPLQVPRRRRPRRQSDDELPM